MLPIFYKIHLKLNNYWVCTIYIVKCAISCAILLATAFIFVLDATTGLQHGILQPRRQRGAEGALPPRFLFLPPDLFLALPRYFFGGKNCFFWAGKTVLICDFGQKKPSDFGEDFFFSRSPDFY